MCEKYEKNGKHSSDFTRADQSDVFNATVLLW